jgi:hypothetical protein
MSTHLSNSTVAVDEAPTPEAAKESGKQAGWVLLWLHGLLLGLASIYWILRGRLFDPGMYEAVAGPAWTLTEALLPAFQKLVSTLARLIGIASLVAAIFIMTIAATSYRRYERWAWYAMWALPLHATLELATFYGCGALTATTAAWDVSLLTLSLLGLLLPYRAFFADVSEPPSAS